MNKELIDEARVFWFDDVDANPDRNALERMAAFASQKYQAGYDAAIEALEYKERAEWIPVEQNPNPQSGQYLVTVYAGFVTEAYRTDRWYQADDDVEMNAGNFNEVIAYRRLPEPYEGGTR